MLTRISLQERVKDATKGLVLSNHFRRDSEERVRRETMDSDDDNPPSPRGELLGDGDEAEGAGVEETAGDDTGEQRKGDEGAHAPQQPMVAAASPAASGSPAPQPVNLAQTIAAFSAKLSENKQLEELAAPLLQALLQQLPAAATPAPDSSLSAPVASPSSSPSAKSVRGRGFPVYRPPSRREEDNEAARAAPAASSPRPAAARSFPTASQGLRRVDQSAAARSPPAAAPPAAARAPAKSHYASVEEAQRDLESIAGELAAARGGPATIPFRDVARAWRARHAGADKARRLLPEGAGDARTLPGALAAVAGLPERGAWRAVPAGVWRGRLVARLVQTAGGAGDVAMAEAAEPATTGPVAGDESDFRPAAAGGGPRGVASVEALREAWQAWFGPQSLAGACAALVGQPEQRAEMALLKALQHIGARANARTRKVELQAGIGAAAARVRRVASGGADSDGGAGHDCDIDFGDGTDAEDAAAAPQNEKRAAAKKLTVAVGTSSPRESGSTLPDTPSGQDGETRRCAAADFMETRSDDDDGGSAATPHTGRDSATRETKAAASMDGLEGTGADGAEGGPSARGETTPADIRRIGQAMLRALPRRGERKPISGFKRDFRACYHEDRAVEAVLDEAGLPRLRTAIRMFFPGAVTVQPPTGPLWYKALRAKNTAIDVTTVGDARAALARGLRLASQWRELNGLRLRQSSLHGEEADVYHLYDAVVDATGSVEVGATGRLDNVQTACQFVKNIYPEVPILKPLQEWIRKHLSDCVDVYRHEKTTFMVRITALFGGKPEDRAAPAPVHNKAEAVGPPRAPAASRSDVDEDLLEIGQALLQALQSIRGGASISKLKGRVGRLGDDYSIVFALRVANLPLLRTSLRLFFDGAVRVGPPGGASASAPRKSPGRVSVTVRGDLESALGAGLAAAMEWRRLNGPAGTQLSEGRRAALEVYDVLTDATGSTRPGAAAPLDDVARLWSYMNAQPRRALQRVCGAAAGEGISPGDVGALLPRLLGGCVEIVPDDVHGAAVRIHGLLDLNQEHLRGPGPAAAAAAAVPGASDEVEEDEEEEIEEEEEEEGEEVDEDVLAIGAALLEALASPRDNDSISALKDAVGAVDGRAVSHALLHAHLPMLRTALRLFFDAAVVVAPPGPGGWSACEAPREGGRAPVLVKVQGDLEAAFDEGLRAAMAWRRLNHFAPGEEFSEGQLAALEVYDLVTDATGSARPGAAGPLDDVARAWRYKNVNHSRFFGWLRRNFGEAASAEGVGALLPRLLGGCVEVLLNEGAPGCATVRIRGLLDLNQEHLLGGSPRASLAAVAAAASAPATTAAGRGRSSSFLFSSRGRGGRRALDNVVRIGSVTVASGPGGRRRLFDGAGPSRPAKRARRGGGGLQHYELEEDTGASAAAVAAAPLPAPLLHVVPASSSGLPVLVPIVRAAQPLPYPYLGL
eukprot:tig00000404_g384.t1